MERSVERFGSSRWSSGLSGLFLLLLLSGCGEVTDSLGDQFVIQVPQGFPAMTSPENNPPTPEKIELGRYLFYDARLSVDETIACASCHRQEHAFSDTLPVSFGVEGRTGTRNAPSLANIGYSRHLLWEGGVPTLEQQAIVPIIHPDEMNMNTDSLVVRLRGIPFYQNLFEKAWGGGAEGVTFDRVTRSIAAFQRTLLSGNSRFDQYNRGDSSALNQQEKRGRELFFGETGDCFHCHISYNLSDDLFHNNGLAATADEGRFSITGRPTDKGSFRTPTLRNIALTGPYMHDGRFTSLKEVVDFYNRGGDGHVWADPLVRPLELTEQDVEDLIAFLGALTDEEFITDTTLSNPW